MTVIIGADLAAEDPVLTMDKVEKMKSLISLESMLEKLGVEAPPSTLLAPDHLREAKPYRRSYDEAGATTMDTIKREVEKMKALGLPPDTSLIMHPRDAEAFGLGGTTIRPGRGEPVRVIEGRPPVIFARPRMEGELLITEADLRRAQALRDANLWPQPITAWDDLLYKPQPGGEPVIQHFGEVRPVSDAMRLDEGAMKSVYATMATNLERAIYDNVDMDIVFIEKPTMESTPPGAAGGDPLLALGTVRIRAVVRAIL